MEAGNYFAVQREGDIVRIIFNENTKIDARNYSEIEDEVMNIIDDMSSGELIFDLCNVVYVSSAGLRMFSTINSEVMKEGIEYCLVNLKTDILKMFQLTGYASMFRVEGRKTY